MAKYTVTDNMTLQEACITLGWFTQGSSHQFDKLFYANEHGCPIEEIATIIWLCSDEEVWCRRDILAELRDLKKAHEEQKVW